MKMMSVRWSLLLVLVVGLVAATSAVSGFEGRWKLAGDGSCYWDANDSGPDQCPPTTPTGRWKLGSDDSCVWDASDSGPDQCTPPADSPTAERRADSMDEFMESLSSPTTVPANGNAAPAPGLIPGS
jgi:hypothetical protein